VHGLHLEHDFSSCQEHSIWLMDDCFGVPMNVGTISQSEKTTTEVIAEPVEEARA
jgi:hypothetical protein